MLYFFQQQRVTWRTGYAAVQIPSISINTNIHANNDEDTLNAVGL